MNDSISSKLKPEKNQFFIDEYFTQNISEPMIFEANIKNPEYRLSHSLIR